MSKTNPYAAPERSAPASAPVYASRTVVVLAADLEARGLDKTGKKAEMVARLKADDASKAADAASGAADGDETDDEANATDDEGNGG